MLGVWGPQGTRVLAAEGHWKEPEKWNRQAESRSEHRLDPQRMVFCASLADIFEDWSGQMTNSQEHPLWINEPTGDHFEMAHQEHTRGILLDQERSDRWQPRPMTLDDARTRLWSLIRRTPHLNWQLLTKRPENIARMMPAGNWPNVWLGASVETQEYTWRLDALQEARERVHCPVLFCSAEPLLEDLKLGASLSPDAINWVIIGGESGSNARIFVLEWCRSLIKQCRRANVACFVKQAGSKARMELEMLNRNSVGRVYYSGKGGNPDEWPDWMRVRQFPF